MTNVVHASKGDRHAVVVAGLDVLVIPDGQRWFARGIQIDYAASGDSLEDVKQRFQRGFALTISAHLDRFGDLAKLLKWAPEAVVKEFMDMKACLSFTSVSLHEIPEIASRPEIANRLPIGGMQFAEQRAA